MCRSLNWCRFSINDTTAKRERRNSCSYTFLALLIVFPLLPIIIFVSMAGLLIPHVWDKIVQTNPYWEWASKTCWGWIFVPFVVIGFIIAIFFASTFGLVIFSILLLLISYILFLPYFCKGLMM